MREEALLYQAVKKLLLLVVIATSARADELLVGAAASLQDALREIGTAYTRDHVSFSFAASNILAAQIRAGAPVDVFFSADEKTMDKVADRVTSRRDVLSNELVVVSTQRIHDLRSVRRLALGDPNAVPAGVYAREYFEKNGMWKAIEPRVIPMENVRAALAAADNESVDAAVVYRTDALLAKRARIVMTLKGPRIRYPAAVLRGSKHPEAAKLFVQYLGSPAAAAVFKKYGFVTLPQPRQASSRSGDTTSTRPARSRS